MSDDDIAGNLYDEEVERARMQFVQLIDRVLLLASMAEPERKAMVEKICADFDAVHWVAVEAFLFVDSAGMSMSYRAMESLTFTFACDIAPPPDPKQGPPPPTRRHFKPRVVRPNGGE